MDMLFVKIKDSNSRERPDKVSYKNKIYFSDYKKLAQFLLDLKAYGAKIDKAIEFYKEQETKEIEEQRQTYPW